MIGVQIRKTRLGANLTLENLADRAGITADMLEVYEMGEKPIPMPELEALVVSLNVSIRDYPGSPQPNWPMVHSTKSRQRFYGSSRRSSSFVCKPVNRPYLELAQRLSEMSVDRLRTVAEVLLEITL